MIATVNVIAGVSYYLIDLAAAGDECQLLLYIFNDDAFGQTGMTGKGSLCMK